jgi:hypothetical protein
MKGEPELPEKIGHVDDQSGEVTAGNGNYPRTYAIARLTVGHQVATYPLVFEPRKSFKARIVPPTVVAASLPIIKRPPPAPIVLSQKPAALPPSAPPPPAPSPGSLNFTLPSLGPPPPVGPVSAATTPPPAPPAPPPPPGSAAPTALQLTLQAPALTLAPPSSVIPPPAPPIQPAPPGGARKEARQKQAATAKSESANSEGAGEKSESGGGDESAMTRHQPRRADRYAFTALAAREQPSAWGRGALYGGAITTMALLLALGSTVAGPRSRRRRRDVPVPAPVWKTRERR